MQEGKLAVGLDHHQSVGLGDLRGDLRQVLGARNAHGDRKPELAPHPAPDRACNVGGRAEQVSAAGDIGKRLVDGDPLDQGREIVEHADRGITEPLIVLEVAVDEDQLRAEFAGAPSRHGAVDPERLGLVGGREHHPAANGDGLAAQGRVEHLLDRGIEGIQVRVEDGGWRFHPDRLPAESQR